MDQQEGDVLLRNKLLAKSVNQVATLLYENVYTKIMKNPLGIVNG